MLTDSLRLIIEELRFVFAIGDFDKAARLVDEVEECAARIEEDHCRELGLEKARTAEAGKESVSCPPDAYGVTCLIGDEVERLESPGHAYTVVGVAPSGYLWLSEVAGGDVFGGFAVDYVHVRQGSARGRSSRSEIQAARIG